MTTVYSKNGSEFDIDDIATDLNNKADKDLKNVDAALELVQYMPFSIVNGTILNGENNTLTYSGSTITCDPCTIKTCDGRTKVFDTASSIDISNQSDGSYSIFKDYETGNLSLVDEFKISNVNLSSDYWLDTSTIPANLKVNGVINNDLVYIGDCTIENGGVTALVNRYFNDSGYLIEKHFPTQPFMPDYASGITIPASTDWNCPSDGIVVCERDIYINGTRIYIFSSYSGYNTPNSMTALISKNEVVRCSSSAMFYPMKGAN